MGLSTNVFDGRSQMVQRSLMKKIIDFENPKPEILKLFWNSSLLNTHLLVYTSIIIILQPFWILCYSTFQRAAGEPKRRIWTNKLVRVCKYAEKHISNVFTTINMFLKKFEKKVWKSFRFFSVQPAGRFFHSWPPADEVSFEKKKAFFSKSIHGIEILL